MFDHEVPPPAGTWEKLSERLDEWQHDKTVQARMENISIPPPARSWEQILEKISPEKPATRVIPWKNWLAAASVLLALSLSAYFLTRSTVESTSQPMVQEQPDTSSMEKTGGQTATDTQEVEKEPVESRTYAAIMNTVSSSVLHNARKVMSSLSEPTDESRRATTEQAHHKSSGYDLGVMAASTAADNSDRYYNLLDENGNLVRVSKKLSSLDCVIKNGMVVPIDQEPAGTTDDCTEKVKEWHKIMSTAPAIISPLDLLQVLSNGK